MKQYIKNLGKVRPTADGEHNSSIEYDVLCIVRSGNASYISRCRVPKNTPITNVQYWQLLCSGGGTVVDTDRIFDGGRADSNYDNARYVNGGNANSSYTDIINCGNA